MLSRLIAKTCPMMQIDQGRSGYFGAEMIGALGTLKVSNLKKLLIAGEVLGAGIRRLAS